MNATRSHAYLAHTTDDEAVSPLPHFYDSLIRRRLFVGKGFLTQYLGEKLNERVKAVVASQLRQHAEYGVLVTGHSLGGALSTLTTYELGKLHPNTHVLHISFGAPRHVNKEFTRVLARLPNVRCYRVTNELDVVTRSRLNPSFKHLGHTIWLHHKRVSPPKAVWARAVSVTLWRPGRPPLMPPGALLLHHLWRVGSRHRYVCRPPRRRLHALQLGQV